MSIAQFCDKPSGENFRLLKPYIQSLIYSYAQYAIESNHGNIQFAQKAINIYQYNNILSTKAKRGFNSLLLCLNLLRSDDFVKLKRVKNYPLFKIYLDSKHPAWTIVYSRDLRGKFTVMQTSSEFGMDKELVLDYENCKEYFLDLFATNTSLFVRKIDCWMNPDKMKKFYKIEIGVIWNEDECARCIDKKLAGDKLSKKCVDLLEKECYNEIRHGIDFSDLDKPKEEDKDSSNPVEESEYIQFDDDPYDVLDIPRDSDRHAIKRAYMEKARYAHPDKGGDPEKFKKIHKAYTILILNLLK